jgi:hypothetical protein
MIAPSVALAAGVAGLAAGSAVWLVGNRPGRVVVRPPRRRPGRRPERQVHWLALSGLPLTPRRLTVLTWAAGGVVGLLTLALLHNPIAAAAFGFLGSQMPESWVRRRVRARWQRLDRAALAATTNLRFWLRGQRSVLESLRTIVTRTDEPFRSWLQACLADEAASALVGTTGVRVEDSMRIRARAIRHVELMLLADLLAAERQSGPTAESLGDLVDQWTARARADAVRRGQLSMGLMLSRNMIPIGIGILAALGLTHVGLVSSGAGIAVYGVGCLLVATAGYIEGNVLRQAEAI